MHGQLRNFRFVCRFGQNDRYILTKMYTRSKDLSWFVTDTHVTNEETGLYEIIRQAPSREEAVKGLE